MNTAPPAAVAAAAAAAVELTPLPRTGVDWLLGLLDGQEEVECDAELKKTVKTCVGELLEASKRGVQESSLTSSTNSCCTTTTPARSPYGVDVVFEHDRICANNGSFRRVVVVERVITGRD